MVKSKIVILIEENPKLGGFDNVCRLLGREGINPLNLLDPEAHTLSLLYKNIFEDRLANELLAYLVQRHPNILVMDIVSMIHDVEDELVIVNTSILLEEDIKFLNNSNKYTFSYNLTGDDSFDAREIYRYIKEYRDYIEDTNGYYEITEGYPL